MTIFQACMSEIGTSGDMMDDTLIAEAEKAFIRAREERITLVMDAIQAWNLMRVLKLACKHLALSGSMRSIAEYTARDMQAAVASTPALNRLANMMSNEKESEDGS